MAPDPSPFDDRDPFDPDRLRLPSGWLGEARTSKLPPRHGEGEPFLRGPIPFAWMARASRLPGAGLSLAMLCRFVRDRFPNRPRRYALAEFEAGLGASPSTIQRAFREAERAGVLRVERKPGRKPTVGIIEPPGAEAGAERKPLFGPIPWRWWHRTLRLPGKAPQVAVACWLVAGWERSAEVELALGEWAELGLSRQAAGRGLDTLERAELVTVRRARGQTSTVTLIHAPSGATSLV